MGTCKLQPVMWKSNCMRFLLLAIFSLKHLFRKKAIFMIFQFFLQFWPFLTILTIGTIGLLWTWRHFRQLRTSSHDNHSDMTIKSDTGPHLQYFLKQVFSLSIRRNIYFISVFLFLSGATFIWQCFFFYQGRNIYLAVFLSFYQGQHLFDKCFLFLSGGTFI